MKKIVNPWESLAEYNCFGCCPTNELGLKMEFYEDGDDIVSTWHPTQNHQGWINTLHGGIQATLADEISSWVIFRKFQTSGVTSKMEIKYLKPINTTEDHLTLRARVKEQKRNIVFIDVDILNSADELCTKATCVFFTFPKEKAHKEFHFEECKLAN